MDLTHDNFLFDPIKEIILQSRKRVYRMANSTLLESYWHIGRLIVEDEQKGNKRAEYGKEVLKILSAQLTIEFGKGFDYTNLTNMRKFYLAFPIFDALRQKLGWTHYRLLCRVDSEVKRNYCLTESIDNNWNSRTLQRQINSLSFERVLQHKKHPEQPDNIQNIIKGPDLKTGELTHPDIGQIDMYVRMYDDLKRIGGDNPTIGILLCSQKDEAIVKYSVLNDKNNLFAKRRRIKTTY